MNISLEKLLSPIQVYNPEHLSTPAWAFSTDSREEQRGGWFVALRGETFNGNEYASQAIDNGAKGLILDQEPGQKLINSGSPILIVEDGLKAYQKIAQCHRESLTDLKVIAITGSNGKTSSKEMLYAMLQTSYGESVIASQANENNEIGVPKNILRATDNTRYLILEFGMRGLGEIGELTEIACPDYALITNIGTAHIERLETRENIAQAKAEIFTNSEKGIHVWINKADQQILAPYITKQRKHFFHFYEFTESLTVKGQKYNINCLHPGILNNLIGLIEIARLLDITPEPIQDTLDSYAPSPGRGNSIKHTNGATIIDDTYNANPEAIRALVESMQYIERQKVLVLGDILESKKNILEEMLQDIAKQLDYLYLVSEGDFYQEYTLPDKAILFSSLTDLSDYIQAEYTTPDYLIAIKASRPAGLDRLVSLLTTQ